MPLCSHAELVPTSHIKWIGSFSRTPHRVAIGHDAFARYDVDAFARYELSRGEGELLPGSSARSVIAMCAILQCDGMGFDAVRAMMLPALLFRSPGQLLLGTVGTTVGIDITRVVPTVCRSVM